MTNKAVFGRREKERIGSVDTVQTVHQDGSIDFVDRNALGGALHQMPEGYFRSVQFIGTVVAVCCASICAYLGWVLPANTLFLINEDIGPSPNISWLATVWTLGSAVGFLLVGRVSDIFGRKWMAMGTLVGNIVGCTAHSVNALIGANLCNGLAAAGQLSFGIVLGELVPNRQRGPIVTLVFLSSLPFAVFGPVIARSFILHTSAGWRCSYYLGIVMSVMALLLYQFMYHPPTYDQLHVHGKTKCQQMAELDYGGMFLFTAGMILFLVGLSWGGTIYPWKSAQVLCTLIIGAATVAALVVYEAFIVKQHALIPIRLFTNIGYVAVTACATIAAMIYYSMTILWPTIIGTIYSTDIITIGWQSSVVGGGYQTIIASCLAFAFVTSSLSSISQNNHAAFIVLGVLGCMAIGFVDNITFPGVTLVVEPQDIGLASGVLGSIRACGGAIAQALYVSVLQNKIAVYLPEYVAPAALSAGLPSSSLPAPFDGIATGNFSNVPGMNLDIVQVVGGQVTKAYISSFRIVFYTTIPFSALLILAACFVPNMEMFLGNNVAKRLQSFSGSERSRNYLVVEGVKMVEEAREGRRHQFSMSPVNPGHPSAIGF